MQFLAGWTLMIQDYGEPSDFYNYPSHLYEEIYVVTPGFADMFQGDISLDFSGYIDPEDPIAFSLFPEGVEIIATDETGQETVLVEDAMQSLMFSAASSAQTKPGMQWKELKKLLIPSVNSTGGNKLDLTLNFGGTGGVVLYDKDGDLETTKNDQVKISGQTGIKNLKTTAGIEWHPNYNPFNLDLLPQQIIFKTTYDKVNQIKAEFSKGVNLEKAIKKMNEELNSGFENKHKFLGMNIEGIDFKNQIAIGALGINLGTPVTYYATLGKHQDKSKVIGFSPVLLIIPVIDITGKLDARLTVAYTYNSYVENGINIQKTDFTGAYGPLESNLGQRSMDLPFDRKLEIFDLEAKSKTKKDEEPVPTLIVETGGNSRRFVWCWMMAGLMLNGIIPAAVKANGYARAKSTLNGTAKWEDSLFQK